MPWWLWLIFGFIVLSGLGTLAENHTSRKRKEEKKINPRPPAFVPSPPKRIADMTAHELYRAMKHEEEMDNSDLGSWGSIGSF